MKKKKIVYSNNKEQDFSTVKVKSAKIPNDFKFVHTNIFYRFFSSLVYSIAIPFIFLYEKLLHNTKVINRKKVISTLKHTGCFIYSNHTSLSDGYIQQSNVLIGRKRGYVISLEDTFATNKFLCKLLLFLGGIPIPSQLKPARNFLKCLKTRLEEKAAIIIYPEGTIWPYYTSQRPTRPGAFKYPRMYNVPVIFSCTTFRKPKGLFKRFKKPRIVIYLSDPIFPSRNDQEKLDETRLKKLYEEFMETFTSIPENYSYYEYVPEEINEIYLEKKNKNN